MSEDNQNDKHCLNDILNILMEECDIDDAQLARETGIPASSISRMRINKNANPTASTLRPIAKFFCISISQLLGDEPLSPDRLPGLHNPSMYTSSRLPVIQWDFILNWLSKKTDMNKIITYWISTERYVSSCAFALIINTNTFGLAFRKGSLIIIDPEKKCEDGDLILINDDKINRIILRQVLIDGNDKHIRSVNPDIKKISPLETHHVIIGTVIETRFSTCHAEENIIQNEASYKASFIYNKQPQFT